MRPTLKISLFLNLVLLVGIFFTWNASQNSGSRVVSSSNGGTTQPGSGPATGEALGTNTNDFSHLSFHWSRLESPNDYRKYIANLRAAGCPEATVEDIVRGDAARAFAFKRRELGLSATGNGPWSLQQEHALVASLLQKSADATKPHPKTEEAGSATKLATLAPFTLESNNVQASSSQPLTLAGSPATEPASGNQNANSSSATASKNRRLYGRNISIASTAPPQYPLVLQNVNWQQLGLTTEQQAAVQQLKQQFIQKIGGPDQNPNDPAYLKRWRQAQPQSDLLFKAMLGVTAWENFQVMAADSGSQAQNPYASDTTLP